MSTAVFRRARLVGAGLFLLGLVAACSESAAPTGGAGDTTPPAVVLTSPARLADVEAATFLVADDTTGASHLLEKPTRLSRWG